MLKCSYEQDECILKKVSLLGRSGGVEFGGTEEEKTNVKVINIIDSELDYLPKELETEFPNAYIIKMKSVHVGEVLGKNFLESQHQKIQSLTIDSIKNNVKMLSSEFFELLPEIRHVHISNSNFGAIDSDLFKNSPNVRSIEIQNNKINTIPSDVFNGINDLKSLRFQNNGLTFLDKTFFQDLETLVEVDFSNNKIGKIEPLTFEYLRSVRAVDLTGNVCVSGFFGLGSSPKPAFVHDILRESEELKKCYSDWK